MDGSPQLIEKLLKGETIQFRPRGNSMKPRIKSGELVTIVPCKLADIKKGDIVYCKVNGNIYVHLVSAVGQDGAIQISNNHGHVNGWTRTVFGRLSRVDP